MNYNAKNNGVHIIYVIDPPGLILDSVYILTSIREVMPDIPIIAYCPANKIDILPPFVIDMHSRLNAEIRPMETEKTFTTPYRHGNKIIACSEERKGEYTIFLDTDIFLAKPLDLAYLCQKNAISVSPEGVMTWGKPQGAWEMIYESFGLKFPDEKIRLTRSNRESPPYFNAGVVVFPNKSGFAQQWLKSALHIDAHPDVENKRPWLDQISLPIAAKLCNLNFNILPKEFNFSLSRNQKDSGKEAKMINDMNKEDPAIIHYHAPKFFQSTKYKKMVDDCIEKHTNFSGHEELLKLFKISTRKLWEIRDEIDNVKKIENKNEFDIEYLNSLRDIRENIKSGVHDPFHNWPESIIR